jgi:hypothetical protein
MDDETSDMFDHNAVNATLDLSGFSRSKGIILRV